MSVNNNKLTFKLMAEIKLATKGLPDEDWIDVLETLAEWLKEETSIRRSQIKQEDGL